MDKRVFKTACCILLLSAFVFSFAAGSAVPSSAKDDAEKLLKVGVSGKMAPLLYINENGSVYGVLADMMRFIAESFDYDLEYVTYQLPVEALSALDDGEVDAVLGTFAAKAESFKSFELSRELYAATLCIVEPKSLTDEASILFGAYERDTTPSQLTSMLDAGSVNAFSSQDALLDYLLYGPPCRAIAIRDCVSYRLQLENLENTFTLSPGNVGYVSFCIALKGNNLLTNYIDKGIVALRSSSEYDSILKHWGIQTQIEEANVRYARLIKIIAAIVAGASAIVLVFVAINMRLRALVRAKTAELSEKVDDLEHSSSLRNALIEQASAGSMVLRLDGTILLMNDAMRKIAGLKEGDVVTNVSDLGVINAIWEKSPSEMDHPELYTMRGGDGRTQIFRYQNHRSANHDERVFIIEDITREESEKQEAFEEDKNRALNRIIAGLAHEIKNPLTTLNAYAHLAADPDDYPEFYESFSKNVPGEINRISRLVESLVNYSRPVRSQKERVRLSDIADSCLGLAYVSSKNKISIESNIDADLYVSANADQLRQALLNLLLNSIESIEEARTAGKDGCVIRLSIYRSGGNAVIEIYDTGTGMSDEQLRSCTDPFYTTKQSGTGMGLALTKQYIKENGGTLDIESVLGKYTAMRMIFAEDDGDE